MLTSSIFHFALASVDCSAQHNLFLHIAFGVSCVMYMYRPIFHCCSLTDMHCSGSLSRLFLLVLYCHTINWFIWTL